MNLRRYSILAAATFLMLILQTGCKENRWEVNTSNIQLEDVKITRFENMLFTFPENEWETKAQQLYKEHPLMLDMMMGPLFQIGYFSDLEARKEFKDTVVFENDMRDSLFRDVMEKYPPDALTDVEKELTQSFKRLKYYYPHYKTPKVYTSLSAFMQEVVMWGDSVSSDKDSILVIFPDRFMGPGYKYYYTFEFPDYAQKWFVKERMLPSALEAIFEEFYLTDLRRQPLLHQMIHSGKRLFFIDVMAPNLHDSLKIRYSQEQLQWCKDFEPLIWEQFANQDVLYNNNFEHLNRYLGEGPYTNAPNFPIESAPRLGEWVGWQIVKKYMAENKEVSLHELMIDRDYPKILSKARYKPK